MKIEFDTEDLCREDAQLILEIINELYPLTVLDTNGVETLVRHIDYQDPESLVEQRFERSLRLSMSIDKEFLE